MYRVSLIGGKSFYCDANENIIAGALRNGIFLEHSCLSGRCSSCKCKVISGQTNSQIEEYILSKEEKSNGYILSCIHTPKSDIELEIEDLTDYGLSKAKILPAKISEVSNLTENIILVSLRLPPNQKPKFLEGQYVNVIKGSLKRSYSIANASHFDDIQLIIKNYEGGKMSKYWFEEARVNDILRLEIPLGTFFLRKQLNQKNLVFLATGTGIAPIKAIFENPSFSEVALKYERVILLWGMKYSSEIFWTPSISTDFITVLSREGQPKQYIQNVLVNLNLNFEETVIYACGSNDMIQASKLISLQKGLPKNSFYSDAFVASN